MTASASAATLLGPAARRFEAITLSGLRLGWRYCAWLVLAEKRQVIRKSGLLEYYPSQESLGSIGGLGNLKAWLGQRATAFSERACSFGLPAPKGLLLLGVQGCGKSLTARAVASQWNLPLLRLDMGRIFSGLVGSSEENIRKAMAIAESIAPAILWVDELEVMLLRELERRPMHAGKQISLWRALMRRSVEETDGRSLVPIQVAVPLAALLACIAFGGLLLVGFRFWQLLAVAGVVLLLARRRA